MGYVFGYVWLNLLYSNIFFFVKKVVIENKFSSVGCVMLLFVDIFVGWFYEVI